MMKPEMLSSISIVPNLKNVYRALGYSAEKTECKGILEKDLHRYIEEARGFIELKGVWLRKTVLGMNEREIILEEGIALKSMALAQFLKGSQEVLLFGATAGSAIMEKMASTTKENDLTRTVVYNAVAGEMVDEALTWIGQYVHQQIRREGLELDTRRFSAGYGDFGIEAQKIFWKLLALQDIGVTLTEQYFLVPEKSVTAISGIRAIR